MVDEAKVVSVTTFNVTSRNVDSVVRQAGTLLRDTAPTLGGFIEGLLLTKEDETQVILLMHWESRDAWARAQWNEYVSRGVAELYEETASYTIDIFNEVTQTARQKA